MESRRKQKGFTPHLLLIKRLRARFLQSTKGAGFTIIELVVVIALITALLGIASGLYFGLRERNSLDSETERIASTLRLAQSRTLAAENFSRHGVHFDASAGTYTLFEGSDFIPGAAGNKTSELDESVIFNAITVGTAANPDVVFKRVSGTTSDNGYVELAAAGSPADTRVICVEETGNVVVLDPNQVPADCEAADIEFTDGTTDADLASFPGTNGDVAQSITTGSATTTVGRVDLFLRYVDSDGDGKDSDLFLEIRADNALNLPTGPIIGRSLIVDGSDVSDNSLAWQQFIFPKSVELSPFETYYLRLRSLPDSTEVANTAEQVVHWGYDADNYSGGLAWKSVTLAGASALPNNDFSFRVFDKEPPPATDWRTLDFNLGFSLRGKAAFILDFGGVTTTQVAVNDFLDLNQTEFEWEDTIIVNGEHNHLRIHSRYIDGNDTILHVHRGCDENETPVDIDIDTIDLVQYSSGACDNPSNPVNEPIKGVTIENMIAR